MPISISPDGRFLHGVIDDLTGEDVRYMRCDRWLDGSPMNDAFCDGVLYRKLQDGSYWKRVLPGGKINMGWFMAGDGHTDTLQAWNKFNAYMNQGLRNYKAVLVFPAGRYYSSNTVVFDGNRYIFEADAATFLFPSATCIGFQFKGNYAGYYKGKVFSIEFIGPQDPNDGIVDPTSQKFKDYCAANNIPGFVRDNNGNTLQSYMDGAHGNRIASFDPLDYQYHAIFTTAVVYFEELRVTNCSGCGIFFWGRAVGRKDELAPDGYDCSMSSINFAVFRNCRGPAVGILGADANHIHLHRIDSREGGTVGISDGSQSGTMVSNCHSAVNHWGDYWMISNGDWSLDKCYAEVNSHVHSIYAGNGTATGGPRNTPVVEGYSSLNQRGNYISKLVLGQLAIANEIIFGDQANRYNLLQFSQVGTDGRMHLSVGIGGESINQGLFEIAQAGEDLRDGRQVPVSSAAVAGFYNDGVYHGTTYKGLYPPAGFLWQPGDTLTETAPGAELPRLYTCVSQGYHGADTYEKLIGVALQPGKHPETGQLHAQYVQTVKASTYIKVGHRLRLQGNWYDVVQLPIYNEQGRATFPLSGPITFQSPTLMPEYPRAQWQAIRGSAV